MRDVHRTQFSESMTDGSSKGSTRDAQVPFDGRSWYRCEGWEQDAKAALLLPLDVHMATSALNVLQCRSRMGVNYSRYIQAFTLKIRPQYLIGTLR